jgi:pyruvate kinase
MLALVAAGVDVVRINFSHGTADDHRKRVDALRTAAHEAGRTVGVMADLQGPKIRIGKFASGPIQIKANQEFILDATCTLGDEGRVGLDYPDLVNDVRRRRAAARRWPHRVRRVAGSRQGNPVPESA